MTENITRFLASIGYRHPIHPVLVHLPLGMVIGAFLFALLAVVFKKGTFANSSRHCLFLALVALPPTALLGYVDWQQRLGGASLLAIKMKFILAAVLFVLLLLSAFSGRGEKGTSAKNLAILALSLVVAAGIGYFGGELVYGGKAAGAGITKAPTAEGRGRAATAANEARDTVSQGAALFEERCAMCHAAHGTETKIGPGLKGLYRLGRLPVSGRTVSDENIRRQLKSPYKDMPAFTNFDEQQVASLIAYLETL